MSVFRVIVKAAGVVVDGAAIHDDSGADHTTDSFGTAAWANSDIPIGGSLGIHVSKTGFDTADASIVGGDGDQGYTEIDLTATSGGGGGDDGGGGGHTPENFSTGVSFPITVVDQDGAPVEGATVVCTSSNEPSGTPTESVQTLSTDGSGVCEFTWPTYVDGIGDTYDFPACTARVSKDGYLDGTAVLDDYAVDEVPYYTPAVIEIRAVGTGGSGGGGSEDGCCPCGTWTADDLGTLGLDLLHTDDREVTFQAEHPAGVWPRFRNDGVNGRWVDTLRNLVDIHPAAAGETQGLPQRPRPENVTALGVAFRSLTVGEAGSATMDALALAVDNQRVLGAMLAEVFSSLWYGAEEQVRFQACVVERLEMQAQMLDQLGAGLLGSGWFDQVKGGEDA